MGAQGAVRFLVVLCLVSAASAQVPDDLKIGRSGRGAAGYDAGLMLYEFKGVVTAVNDDTREITLAEAKKTAKTKTFVGVLASTLTGQTPDGKEFRVRPSDFAVGTTLTVYYQSGSRKNEEGKNIKVNQISKFKIEALPKN